MQARKRRIVLAVGFIWIGLAALLGAKEFTVLMERVSAYAAAGVNLNLYVNDPFIGGVGSGARSRFTVDVPSRNGRTRFGLAIGLPAVPRPKR